MLYSVWVDDVESVEKFIIQASTISIILMVGRTGRPVTLCNCPGSVLLRNWMAVNFFVPTVTACIIMRTTTTGYEH